MKKFYLVVAFKEKIESAIKELALSNFEQNFKKTAESASAMALWHFSWATSYVLPFKNHVPNIESASETMAHFVSKGPVATTHQKMT
jgi:hypothetical protein